MHYKNTKTVQGMKIGFYIHALVFTLVNLMLIYINLYVSPDMSDAYCNSLPPLKEQLFCYDGAGERIAKHIWFIYPLLGWGIGLLGHFLGVVFFVKNKSDS